MEDDIGYLTEPEDEDYYEGSNLGEWTGYEEGHERSVQIRVK